MATVAGYIPITAVEGQGEVMGGVLKVLAPLVKESEPKTLHWFGIKKEKEDNTYGIIDFFSDSSGVDDHLSGKAAATLKGKASGVVQGGWDEGIVAKLGGSTVIIGVSNGKKSDPKCGVYVEMQANEGKADELREFLKVGGGLVKETEPGTCLWWAVDYGGGRFAIFDVFETEDARNDHFAGQVAAALKGKADELLNGGWDGFLTAVNFVEVVSHNI